MNCAIRPRSRTTPSRAPPSRWFPASRRPARSRSPWRPARSPASGAVELILDASGSMLQKFGAVRRIDIAKQTLTKLTSTTIPAGTPFAMRVFGREVDSCQTDLDVPVGPLNAAAVGQRIAALNAKNGAKTPIGASLAKVADDLKSRHRREAHRAHHRWRGNLRRRSGRGDREAAQGRHRHARQHRGLRARRSELWRRRSGAGRTWAAAPSSTPRMPRVSRNPWPPALRPGFEVVNAQGQVHRQRHRRWRRRVRRRPAITPCGIKGALPRRSPWSSKPKETASRRVLSVCHRSPLSSACDSSSSVSRVQGSGGFTIRSVPPRCSGKQSSASARAGDSGSCRSSR